VSQHQLLIDEVKPSLGDFSPTSVSIGSKPCDRALVVTIRSRIGILPLDSNSSEDMQKRTIGDGLVISVQSRGVAGANLWTSTSRYRVNTQTQYSLPAISIDPKSLGMLSADERAGAALKLRVLQADLVALFDAETTAQSALLAKERAFVQALKSMRDAHATFERAQVETNEKRRKIHDTRRAIEVGDRAALGGFDIGMLARVQALVAQDLADIAAPDLVSDSGISIADLVEIHTPLHPFDLVVDSDAQPGPSRSPSASTAFTRLPTPIGDDRREAASTMSHLRIELISKICQAAAELFVELDRKSVLNIAISCPVGYYAVIPVLYRTLLMTQGRSELAMRVFRTKTNRAIGDSTLNVPPSERLCSLVRRLCVTELPKSFTVNHCGARFAPSL